jgi:hypothetical protein
MAESSGWGNVILPSNQPSLGEITQRGNEMDQRQFQQTASLLMRQNDKKEAEARKNQMYNLNQIGDLSDEKAYQTGEQAIDTYSHRKLQEIQDWAMQNAIDKDPAVAAQMIRQKLQPFLAWNNQIKSTVKEANAGLTEFNKTYPNANAVRAHKAVFDNVAKDYMQQDENGNWIPKPVEFIKPKDYVSELQSPSVLGTIIDDTSPFTQKLHGLEKSIISDADVSNIKGYGKKTKWSATTTPYTDIKPGNDGMPVIDVKHQTLAGVKGEDGQPMKFVDDSIVKDLQGDPKAWASALAMWNQEKPAVEAKLGRKIDPSEEDFRFKNMLYNKLDQFLPHGVKTEQQQIVPKPPRISVHVNAGGSSGKEIPIRDVMSEISQKAEGHANGKGYHLNELSPAAQTAAVELARKITGNTLLGNTNIFIGKDVKGNLHIADSKTGQSIAPLNATDINLTANKSLGVKTKQKIVADGNKNKPAPAHKTNTGYVVKKM